MFRHSLAFLRTGIKTNLVAIISLITALGSMSYDVWGDHRNQIILNQRNASFEVLKNLGELQTIVNYAHYNMDDVRGNPIEGWKYVLLIRDLSYLLPQTNRQQSEALFNTWQTEWDTLKTNSASEQKISDKIADARKDILQTITQLE